MDYLDPPVFLCCVCNDELVYVPWFETHAHFYQCGGYGHKFTVDEVEAGCEYYEVNDRKECKE